MRFTTVKEITEAVGGVEAVMALTSSSYKVVKSWTYDGNIPPGFYFAFRDALGHDDIDRRLFRMKPTPSAWRRA